MRFDPEYIVSLIKESIPESRTHDFKREFYGKDDKGKHELLKDVSAFANTLGGSIILGVEEKNCGVTVIGLDPQNVSQEIERMQSILSTGLEPRLAVEMNEIRIDDKHLLIISVPQSYLSPHRVKKDQVSYFYVRTGTQAEAMDIRQIRDAFVGSEGVFSRARNFHLERVARIDSQNVSRPLAGSTNIVIHMVPIESVKETRFTKAADFSNQFEMSLYEGRSYPPRNFNLDGCFYAYADSGSIDMYAQVFRDGSIELVRSFSDNDAQKMNAFYVDGWIIGAVFSGMSFIRDYFKQDVGIFISLTGVKGILFQTNQWHRGKAFDRHLISLPELITSETHIEEDVIKTMLEFQRHVLFQSAGYQGIVQS